MFCVTRLIGYVPSKLGVDIISCGLRQVVRSAIDSTKISLHFPCKNLKVSGCLPPSFAPKDASTPSRAWALPPVDLDLGHGHGWSCYGDGEKPPDINESTTNG
jgi:hypothetical protein